MSSTHCGPKICQTLGLSARSAAMPSTMRTTSGSCTGRILWSTTRGGRRRPHPRCAAAGIAIRARREIAEELGRSRPGYDWPKSEHGVHIDWDGNVWLAGNDKDDHQILKFTPDATFLQQIGWVKQHQPARQACPHGHR